MCGIAGIFQSTPISVESKESLVKIMKELVSRGPNRTNYWSEKGKMVMLGHNLLAIRNNKSGMIKQPMIYNNLVLTYNGEIYNCEEITKILLNKGYEIHSKCDTEVLIKAYHCFGIKCLEFINGRFSFAIWDSKNKELTIARDRFGLNPLYYYYDDKSIWFSSSLPSLIRNIRGKKELNSKCINYYFSFFGFMPGNETLYKNFFKLPQGHYIKINICEDTKNLKLTLRQYYKFVIKNSIAKEFELSDNEKIKLIKNKIIESIDKRLISDIPVGIWLSGGVDSSLITAICEEELGIKLPTFSIGFEKCRDDIGTEFKYSRQIAKKYNLNHQEIKISNSEIFKNIRQALKIANEPMYSNDYIGHYLLGKYSKENGINVVLTGLGADEVFYGYNWYNQLEKYTDSFDYNNCKNILTDLFIEDDFNKLSSIILPEFLKKDYTSEFLNQYIKNKGATSYDLAYTTSLDFVLSDDSCRRLDSAAMAHSVEARAPFLDHILVEETFKLSTQFKIKHGHTKYLLKKISEDYFSKEFIYRKKGYFSVPSIKYTNGEIYSFCKDVLLSENCKCRGILNQEFINNLIQNPNIFLNELGGNILWKLTCFEYWIQQFD